MNPQEDKTHYQLLQELFNDIAWKELKKEIDLIKDNAFKTALDINIDKDKRDIYIGKVKGCEEILALEDIKFMKI